MTGGGAKTGCFCKGSGGTYEFRTTKSFEVRQRSGVKPEIISVDGIKNHPNALFPEPPDPSGPGIAGELSRVALSPAPSASLPDLK